MRHVKQRRIVLVNEYHHLLASLFKKGLYKISEAYVWGNDFSSAEALFKRFTQMLSHECPKKREVKQYADALCITPKYLSAICKSQSGKTASEIINSITVNHIKNRLTSSDLTIKEIAAEVGFDNLSFFGKYVRRELGMSPRQFRGQR